LHKDFGDNNSYGTYTLKLFLGIIHRSMYNFLFVELMWISYALMNQNIENNADLESVFMEEPKN